MPFHVRLWRAIRRGLRGLLRYPTLAPYADHPTRLHLPNAYVLLERICPDTGRMLSDTWEERRSDQDRRRNLFRGMARVILSLARVPQPRIGSFRFSADGAGTLTNRPLPCCVAILENNGAPRTNTEGRDVRLHRAICHGHAHIPRRELPRQSQRSFQLCGLPRPDGL